MQRYARCLVDDPLSDEVTRWLIKAHLISRKNNKSTFKPRRSQPSGSNLRPFDAATACSCIASNIIQIVLIISYRYNLRQLNLTVAVQRRRRVFRQLYFSSVIPISGEVGQVGAKVLSSQLSFFNMLHNGYDKMCGVVDLLGWSMKSFRSK